MSDYPLDSPSEPLNWAQRQTGYDQGEIDDAGLTINPALSFPWPIDPDERIWAPVYMSLNEYTALLSAVDVGAAIAWTNDALLVYYILVRNYSGGSMEFCAKVIDCIVNDDDVKQAIVDMLSSNDAFNTYISNTTQGLRGGQLTGAIVGGDCDNSILAGQMVALVTRLDGNNTDALEIIEVGTNDEERVAAVLEGIPLLGESPVGDIVQFIQGLLEDFSENYAAASTFERRDNLARDLYCLAKTKENCELTFSDLFDFFQERASSNLTLASVLENIFDYVVNGDFETDDLVFDGLMAIQIAFIRSGREFFGITAPTIGALTRDASPSSAWEDWDTCLFPYVYEWDFTAGNGGWALNGTGQGVFSSSGVEFALFLAGPARYVAAQIKKTQPSLAGITNWEVDLEDVVLGLNGLGGRFVAASWTSGATSATVATLEGDNTYALAAVQASSTEIVVVARASAQNGASGGGSGVIKKIRAYGEAATLPEFTGGEFL